jgi:hypothetical protein
LADDVLEEYAASIFRVEGVERIFLWKSIKLYQTTLLYISENNNPNIHDREDIKHDKAMIFRKANSMGCTNKYEYTYEKSGALSISLSVCMCVTLKFNVWNHAEGAKFKYLWASRQNSLKHFA